MTMKTMQDTMQRAMRLMQSGDLRAATGVIQQALADDPPNESGQHETAPGHAAGTTSADAPPSNCIDVEFRVIEREGAPDVPAGDGRADDRGDTFESHHFSCDAGNLDYKLYIPPSSNTTRAPLLLMLHGCTQGPEDFARGTRMNDRAREYGYVVAYPAQSTQRNANRCWNWFRPGDQKRGLGEPATLAALTRDLISRYSLDENRVYVAGLSAGGAMAAVLASAYPDVYAAIGVHSGLPVGCANDVASALGAMRSAGTARTSSRSDPAGRAVPAIVFHGDRDTTVHPGNADGIVAQALGGADDVEVATKRGTSVRGRGFSRTVHRRRDGTVTAEHWLIEGAGHAWSGGDQGGSYTDPTGPDASSEMLRFFSANVKDTTRSDRGVP